MNYHIDIQHACAEPLPIPDETICQWVTSSLRLHCNAAELTLRFVNEEEITQLNSTYRNKNQPTNVLAFPAPSLPSIVMLDYPLLGDVIVCPSVLKQESESLKKPLAHWAHIIIHGVLHLLGYDHINEDDAAQMQSIEILLLAEFGFNNPYEIEAD